MRKAGKKLIPALFAAYILLLCAVFFLREPIGRVRINLVPFDTIRTYLTRLSENSINTDIVMRGIFGNILLTLPLGAFAAMYAALREKSGKIFLALALSLAFIAATELLQFAFRMGECDIDTIMLRFVGVVIGYGVIRLTSSLIARGRAGTAR